MISDLMLPETSVNGGSAVGISPILGSLAILFIKRIPGA